LPKPHLSFVKGEEKGSFAGRVDPKMFEEMYERSHHFRSLPLMSDQQRIDSDREEIIHMFRCLEMLEGDTNSENDQLTHSFM
jgi:hypothetical protein